MARTLKSEVWLAKAIRAHSIPMKPFLFLLLAIISGACAADADTQSLSLRDTRTAALENRFSRAFQGDLDEMRRRGFIRALVTYSKTDFFFDKQGLGGFQVRLLQEWEKRLNHGVRREADKLRIVFIPVPFERLIPDLLAGKGDIAAALLTVTPERQKQVAFAAGGGLLVSEIVIGGRDAAPLESLQSLAGKEIHVLRGSSYAASLRRLNSEFEKAGKARMRIREADPRLLSEDLLELLDNGVLDYTVVDDYKARLWADVFSNLTLYNDFPLRKSTPVGWAVRKHNPRLLASLKGYTRVVKKGSYLGNMLFRRYYRNARRLRDPAAGKARERLHALVELFKKYADTYGFDYLALAAQGFQESGLDQSRKSHRGAVGVMQLLPSTAASKAVGIPDIHQVENNIHAGVKYLAYLRDRYFSAPTITPEDRLALSWAAYNAGPAKVRKMRALATRLGLNPDRWFQHVEVAAGRITGRETVRYVANIYKYYLAYKLMKDLDGKRELKTAGRIAKPNPKRIE